MAIKIYSRRPYYPPFLYVQKICDQWNVPYQIVESIRKADMVFYPLWVGNPSIADELTDKLIVDNLLDSKKRLCYTGDHCLNNKRELSHKFKHLEFVPRTYVYDDHKPQDQYKLDPNKIYIVKPENEFARKGVYLDYGVNINDKTKVIQEYITNPLLVTVAQGSTLPTNKKFHFRIYSVLFKINNEPCQAYLYNNGFMYFAEKEFSLDDLDTHRHFSGAKYCNVRPIVPYLKQWLGNGGIQNFWEQVQKIIYLTLKDEIKQYNNPNFKNPSGQAFHVLGYDLLPDATGKLHLLEINNGYIGMETFETNWQICQGKPTSSLHDPTIFLILFQGIMYKLLYQKSIIPNFTKII